MPNVTQNTKLETYLRGTGRSLTQAQALARFGIQNLSARMSEFRDAGLNVVVGIATSSGLVKYSVPGRDLAGSRAKRFV